jgi:shikimate kinase
VWTSFIGFMASGKSATARALGAVALIPVVDLDAVVEAAAGLTVPALFAAEGVQGFRARELAALERLDPDQALLLATGGGVVETPAAIRLLQARGVVIWLDAPWEVLRARIEAAGEGRRPMVGHLGWDGMERLYLRRRRLYAACAHFRLRSDVAEPAALGRAALARSLFWRRRPEGGAACSG